MHFDPKLRKKVQNSIPAIKGTNHRPSRVYVFSNWTLQMHSTGLKRSLFSLLGVKTGGGGKRESFMDILSRGKDTGGAASQRAQEKVSVSGWSAGARCRRSEKQWSCSVPQHTILVFSRGSGGGGAGVPRLELEESFLIWPFHLTSRLLLCMPSTPCWLAVRCEGEKNVLF